MSVLQGLSSKPVGFLRLVGLLFYNIKSQLASTQRARARLWQEQHMSFGSEVPCCPTVPTLSPSISTSRCSTKVVTTCLLQVRAGSCQAGNYQAKVNRAVYCKTLCFPNLACLNIQTVYSLQPDVSVATYNTVVQLCHSQQHHLQSGSA